MASIGRTDTSRRAAGDEAVARPNMPDQETGIYQRLVRYVRHRLRSDEDVADVVQDAYARFTAAAQRTEVQDPAAFLHRTALNLVRDRARAAEVRRGMAGDSVPDLQQIASLDPAPDRALAAREQLDLLYRALAELPAKQRAALVLHRFDELSHAEIAVRLGISVSMVEKHIRRALAHCRTRLAEANGDV